MSRPFLSRSASNARSNGNGLENGLDDDVTGLGHTDKHFRMLYTYYRKLGYKNIIVQSICKLATNLFGILFSVFLLSCVNWNSIFNHTTKHLRDALYESCVPSSLWLRIMYTVFLLAWFAQVGLTISKLSHLNEIQELWNKVLLLPEDVKWISWGKVTQVYAGVDRELSEHEHVDDYVAGKIMRFDNYLIAMLNANVFGFDTSWFTFTKCVEFNIWLALRLAFFSSEKGLPREFLHVMNHGVFTRRLRYSFILIGILNIFVVLFASIASIVYYVYRNLSLYQRDPTKVGVYQFTPLARWKLRLFNELPHVFFERLERAHERVEEYLTDFAGEEMAPVYRLVEFVSGSILAVIISVGMMDQSLLGFEIIEGWSLLFVMGTLGAAFMWCQRAVPNHMSRPDPERSFNELKEVLGMTPASWNRLSTKAKYLEIHGLFRLRIVVFLQEILSLSTCWILFIFWLPKRSDTIVQFLREHSVFVPRRGVLCCYADFNQRPVYNLSSSDLDLDPLLDTPSELGNDTEADLIEQSMTLKRNHSFQNFHQSFPLRSSILTPSSLSNEIDSNSDSESDDTVSTVMPLL